MIHLFNTENYKDKPFQTFTIEGETKEIKQMKFSPNGKYILLATRQNSLMLLDAFKGTMVQRFEGSFSGEPTLPLECGFSPDSKYVITGSANAR